MEESRVVRLATRGSPLALWQAKRVAELLERSGSESRVRCELVVVETTADRRLDIPIHAMGGKGVFAKEVQVAVLDGRADVAVHSAKDLPSVSPDELVLAAFPERADPRDVLVGARLGELRPGAVVGTGSVRRRAQLGAHRPDLRFAELRGNIATRLGRLRSDSGLDAIVMAAAALDRLDDLPADLLPGVVDVLDPDVALPQVGQGALAVECRADDAATRTLVAEIDDDDIGRTVRAERAFLATLGGDCTLPAAAHAVLSTGPGPVGPMVIEGMLASLDGATVLRRRLDGDDGEALGERLANELLDAGGDRLLEEARR